MDDIEVDSKLIIRKGFCVILTPKRIELLLSAYPKEVMMLNENTYRGNADITAQIMRHNYQFICKAEQEKGTRSLQTDGQDMSFS